jgi:hypothetical protein
MNSLPKQIVKQNIAFNHDNSEAFVYKFTNLKTNQKYIGIHKGQPFDGYLHSSSNLDFHEDFLSPNAEFQYDVIEYGTYNYVTSVEHTLLKEVNAKDNPEYYNKSNGVPGMSVPRVAECEYVANQIGKKEYNGVEPQYIPVSMLPKHKLQIREFTLQPEHVKSLRDRINDQASLTHLMVVILSNRKYRGRTGDLIIDGNHSIEAAKTSRYGDAGQMPVLRIPEDMHESWTDEEVDLISLMLNPREENPRLPSSLEDIAKQVCNLMLQGFEANSKPIKTLKDHFKLTSNEKSKVSKLARKMYEEINPPAATWIDYGTGSEGREIKKLIEKECVTHGHYTGIFSKCYSTSKYNAWSDLYDMILHNQKNPENLITTYRVRWYHVNAKYKKTWEDKWRKNNETVIDSLLKTHNIKRDWDYLPETRDKVSVNN